MLQRFLILSTVQGNLEILRKFFEEKSGHCLDLFPYSCVDEYGSNLLSLLYKAGAFTNHQFRESLLHVAIATKNIETVKLLIEVGFNVNSYNNRRESALHFAVSSGCNEIVELLVEKNANVNDRRCGISVLNYAARALNESLTIFLLDHGADVNCQNVLDSSALHYGVKFHNPTITAMMLAKGAYVNKRDDNGLTPLHIALKEGNLSVVKLLLDNDADISSKALIGHIPLTMATSRPNPNSYEIVKLLLERGAKCCDNRFNILPPLGSALINCDRRTVKLLLDNGANIRIKNPKKFTALHYAAMNQHVDVIEFILDYGFNINVRSKHNSTPLHIAIKRGYYEGCELLLSRGAEVNCIDDGGKSPLYLAVTSMRYISINLLLEYGAEVCSMNPSYTIMDVAKRTNMTVRNILIEHVAKLVSSNTGVSRIELEVIEKNIEMKSHYEKCIKKCIEELEKMKIQKIYENVYLFNMLMERDMISGYARNEELIEAFNSAENQLKRNFPIYYSLLKKNFYREIKKQRLIKGAAKALNEIFNFYDPFHFANFKILSYLSEEDITKINEIE